MTQKYFKELLGGRIIYSKMFRNCKTLKHDLIVYTTMNKYRAKGRTNWDSANRVKEELTKAKISSGYSIYNWNIINRFYKIRIAIRETKIEFELIN